MTAGRSTPAFRSHEGIERACLRRAVGPLEPVGPRWPSLGLVGSHRTRLRLVSPRLVLERLLTPLAPKFLPPNSRPKQRPNQDQTTKTLFPALAHPFSS